MGLVGQVGAGHVQAQSEGPPAEGPTLNSRGDGGGYVSFPDITTALASTRIRVFFCILLKQFLFIIKISKCRSTLFRKGNRYNINDV